MKNKRHNKILEIISHENIETQEDLISKLRAGGFDVTQATVSRDIRELKLVKIANAYGGYKYSTGAGDDVRISVKYRSIIKATIVKADYACNIAVIKTYPGMAQAAAAAIDSMGWNEIVGSVAGDDTVLIVMRNEEKALEFYKKFNEIIMQN